MGWEEGDSHRVAGGAQAPEQKMEMDKDDDVNWTCTVCRLLMTGAIWQCESGHLLCPQCKWRILHTEAQENKCPTCRIATTFDSRNREAHKIYCFVTLAHRCLGGPW
jgi:hypothetical protein